MQQFFTQIFLVLMGFFNFIPKSPPPLVPSPTPISTIIAIATPSATLQPSPTLPLCSTNLRVGFKITEFQPGRKMAIWYPTTDQESEFSYDKTTVGQVSLDGQINTCQTWPLVVYSHGYTGCGIQSVFFTETLARSGYIVAAPDHLDHGCSVDNHTTSTYQDLNDTDNWTDQTYVDRKNDLEAVIKNLTTSHTSSFSAIIDTANLGLVGHSLGGYTVAGLANAWPSWKNHRVKAVLLFSPFINPFYYQHRIKLINVPTMYQGAVNDDITNTMIDGSNGAFSQTNRPKYFLTLNQGDHFTWINSSCKNYPNISDCIDQNPIVKSINDYGIGFLDQYLKHQSSDILTSTASALIKYEFSP